MTNEQALDMAQKLSEFCNKNECDSCVFCDISVGECRLTHRPDHWHLPVVWSESDILFAKGFLLSGYTRVCKADDGSILIYRNLNTETLKLPKDSAFKNLPYGRNFSLESIANNIREL